MSAFLFEGLQTQMQRTSASRPILPLIDIRLFRFPIRRLWCQINPLQTAKFKKTSINTKIIAVNIAVQLEPFGLIGANSKRLQR
jgi:hypothetical protein